MEEIDKRKKKLTHKKWRSVASWLQRTCIETQTWRYTYYGDDETDIDQLMNRIDKECVLYLMRSCWFRFVLLNMTLTSASSKVLCFLRLCDLQLAATFLLHVHYLNGYNLSYLKLADFPPGIGSHTMGTNGVEN